MAKLEVLNIEGKNSGQLDLPDNIFTGEVNRGVLHQAVVKYQASLRQGTASTKERSQVSGGGKKPYRQKGTGRARAGSSRSPLWRGGGVVFGPHPRDFSYPLPKKIRVKALAEALNNKFQQKQFICIDDVKMPMAKTKEFAKMLKNFNLQGKVLAILDGCDESIFRVSRNIPRFQIVRAVDVNAYDVMRNKVILISKTAAQKILERL